MERNADADADADADGNGVDLSWYPPRNTSMNDLDTALRGHGVNGITFDADGEEVGGGYNWCDMPRVKRETYVVASPEFELRYIEVIQRHHKRTPYASNAFPVEPYHWDCDDAGLYFYGAPFSSDSSQSLEPEPEPEPASSYWKGFISPINPFIPSGWIGTCQFPQLTAAGLKDAYAHGEDIYSVYHDLLSFLPDRDSDSELWESRVRYRVTQNVITSQVAGMVISGTWGFSSSSSSKTIPLLLQSPGIDSLEPQYHCAMGTSLFNSIQSPSNERWKTHLEASVGVYHALDDISGVPPSDPGFHSSFDHYYDNLSARQCHSKALPCKLPLNSTCVSQTLANTVYRLGHWEYSHIYRDSPTSLSASVSSFGVWIAELASHFRAVISSSSSSPQDQTPDQKTLYFHNIAHDGSISRLLSILQIDIMIWPGMGSELVFELYRKNQRTQSHSTSSFITPRASSGFYVRVLFSGRVLRSSNPSLGLMDMLPIEILLAYFDGLVGRDASLVMGKCNGTIKT
ncbi:histidine acid phosphatase [Xylaria sp. CBS 124048]|nr:histidine acid phosphatase [Xylaria sp. CBS 124048]